MYHIIQLFFGFPGGAAWGNFVADPVIAGVSFLLGGRWVKKHLEKHHKEKLAQAESHHQEQMQKLDVMHAHLRRK